jgi:Uma2 family endonuclease
MAIAQQKMGFDAFLAWENAQETRNEFYRGEIFAMVGVRRIHALVTGNVYSALRQHVKGSPCQVFSESLKVKPNADSLFYPDVFVTCDPQDLKTDMVFTSPTLIVEVLSESTQAFDRGLKFAAYRQIAALKEYLLIDPDSKVVELYRRGADGLFTLHDFTGAGHVELRSLNAVLATIDIFEGVDAA